MPLKKFRMFLLACMICALCAVQASALEYSYDGADDFLFARPTSDDTIYEEENPNVDRSKNVALVAPGFGSPTSYLPGSGEHLTPNLVPGALSGGLVNQVGGANYSVSENGASSGMGGFLPSTSILDGGSSSGSTPPEHFTVTTRPNDTASVGFTTTPKGSHESDPFWTKSETALLQAIILMLWQEAPEYEQNFSMVMRVLEYAEVKEEDEEYVSPLDLLFQAIEREKPESVAVRQYRVFKMAAGKTSKSILVSTAVRLAPFNLPQIKAITDRDDMDLYTLGEKKCALWRRSVPQSKRSVSADRISRRQRSDPAF